MIPAKPFAPRAATVGSLAAVAIFITTLSFLATPTEAWQDTSGEPTLSSAGQFPVKDVVVLELRG